MYQTSDQKLRKRILAQNMSYQDTIAWGQSHEESDRNAQLVTETTDREDKVRRLERLQAKQRVTTSCQTCSRPRHNTESSAQNVTHASKQVISKVHLSARAQVKTIKQGLGRRRSRSGRWRPAQTQTTCSQTTRALAA